MDVDAFIRTNRPTWDRLDALLRDARRGRLGASELDELVRLYLRASSHLSTARTVHRDPALTAELAGLVGRAHGTVYGTRARSWRALGRFATTTFPAAVWHARRAVLASTLLFLASALVVGVWFARSDAAVEALAPPEVRQAYLDEDFEDYYSSEPAGQFAASVFTNNARVGVLAFAVGIAWCVPTAAVLVLNGANLGVAAGLFHAAGRAPHFWGLILPHGLLELTAVFIAGGAGLRLGWTLIAPGDRGRGEALAEEGRRVVVIVAGLVVVFLVAGLLEGFVTPSGLPTWARVGTGALVEVVFIAYLLVRGRAAAAVGLTGAVGEHRPTRRSPRLTPDPVT
ncbi:MAG: stage II sporulation protein M [Actinobacteria bacterium]|nr:stage II sporulation protein M [Actinomycetota bacterium]